MKTFNSLMAEQKNVSKKLTNIFSGYTEVCVGCGENGNNTKEANICPSCQADAIETRMESLSDR